jgi:serine/threonine-protein kinase
MTPVAGPSPLPPTGALAGLPVHEDTDIGYPARRDGRDDRPRRRGWIYALVALAVLVVFGGGAYLISTALGGPAGGTLVKIPSVVGLKRAAAQQKLQTEGFPSTVTTKESDEPKGNVLSQDPPAETPKPKGTNVALVVSSGPGTVKIPDVTSLSQADARAALERAGLQVGDVATVDKAKTPEGQVVGTKPGAGQVVAKGSSVALQVASGLVDLPDLTGKDIKAAQDTLAKLGLTSNATQEPSDQPENTVTSQDPRPGKVPVDTVVDLVYAGPQPPPTETPTPSPTQSPTETPGDDGGGDDGGGDDGQP